MNLFVSNRITFNLLAFRYNTAQLEQWARDQKVHSEQINVIESLTHIVQASQLLQVRVAYHMYNVVFENCSQGPLIIPAICSIAFALLLRI